MTESHVVVYCDSCGDLYTGSDGESVCFDTRYQAIAYLNCLPGPARWVYDGDTIICPRCQGATRCAEHAHSFPENRGSLMSDVRNLFFDNPNHGRDRDAELVVDTRAERRCRWERFGADPLAVVVHLLAETGDAPGWHLDLDLHGGDDDWPEAA
ncbi:hypothetical protein [Nocardia sp. NPDC057353]|uniref:hypothetical protein n=1 Tax=Nocardia sp. NPDC057353 TaxID=3346104 RepID=UPI003634B480